VEKKEMSMRRINENEIGEITDYMMEAWERAVREMGSRNVSLPDLVLVLFEVNKKLAQQYLDEITEIIRIEKEEQKENRGKSA
jgi:hypothetical protein